MGVLEFLVPFYLKNTTRVFFSSNSLLTVPILSSFYLKVNRMFTLKGDRESGSIPESGSKVMTIQSEIGQIDGFWKGAELHWEGSVISLATRLVLLPIHRILDYFHS